MPEGSSFSPLRKYVAAREEKNIEHLERVGDEWVRLSMENKLSYEIDWLGIPIIQTPEEIILMQEVIFCVQPDYVIETGIAHGGSLILYASIMEAIGKGKVIGIDIDIREHNKKVLEKHRLFKRLELIEGNSISEEIVDQIKKKIPDGAKVMVCLDSNHYKEHVLKELELYKEFVSLNSYLVVYDTITSKMAELGATDKTYINNGPKEAVEEFLNTNDDFQIDKKFNRLIISYSPDGFLKRIK